MFLRCLVAKKDIKKGDIFSLENIGFFRHPNGNSGLEPKYFYTLKNISERYVHSSEHCRCKRN